MKIYLSKRKFKEIIPNDNSYRIRSIMKGDEVNLKFSLSYFYDFPLGSYIEYQGQKYILNKYADVKKTNNTNFEYTMTLGSELETLKNILMKDTRKRLKFPLTAKPSEHLELIIENLKNSTDDDWKLGECISKLDKLISYNHTNCFDALVNLANAFNTEFEVKNRTIHLKKVEYNKDNPLTLSYGKGNGFVSGVFRKNDTEKANFNILYIQGGEKNIEISKYGNKELLLPKEQNFEYEGISYKTDDSGRFIYVDGGVHISKLKEKSLDLTNIYPKRTGTISEVIVVDSDNNKYDFKDNSIPLDLDYSKQRMNDEKITIKFESGMLSGRTFDIVQSETRVSGYIHSERRFLIKADTKDNILMPNDIFKPEIGDKYVVYGISLPDSYICDNTTKTGASWDMFKEGVKHFHNNHESKFTFKGTLDGIWSKKDWNNIGGAIVKGGYVLFSDNNFQTEGVKIRITSVKDYLNNPYSPLIELANSVRASSVSSELERLKTKEILMESLHKESLEFTKKTFKETLSTIELLTGSKLEFNKGVNPITVNTMQILVGDKNLQYHFVASKINDTKINHQIIYNSSNKILNVGKGVLKHFTLGIKSIKPKHNCKFWTVRPLITPPLVDSNKSYYIYVKANKNNEIADFIISETSILLDEVQGFYHFLVGLLNSEFKGNRSFVKMYGFTEILPGEIKVDKISSTDGSQYIELKDDEINIKGNVTFTEESPAIKQVSDSMEIGASNLLINYNNLDEWKAEKNVNVSGNKVSVTSSKNLGIYQDVTVKKNTNYVLSFFIKNTVGGEFGLGGNASSSIWSGVKKYVPQSVGLNEFKFNSKENTVIRVYLLNGAFELETIQLEEGNKRTSHKVSSKELVSSIKNIVDKTDFLTKTTITGSTVCTGAMIVGNSKGANAGVTGKGTSKDSVRFFAGSDFDNRANAPFRVNEEGEVVMIKADIKGRIEALSGFIGNEAYGLNIMDDGSIELGNRFSDNNNNFYLTRDFLGFFKTLSNGAGAEDSMFLLADSLSFRKGGVGSRKESKFSSDGVNIKGGSIIVDSKKGLTKDVSIYGTTLKFVKGILVGVSYY